MRHTIPITAHNCPADGDSITAEVTLDVADGTVKHIGTRITGLHCCGVDWDETAATYLLTAILERHCDPVAMAVDKLKEMQGSVHRLT